MTIAFKHLPYGADPLAILEKLAPLMLRVMTAPNGLAALTAVLRYALQVSEVDVGALRTLVGTHLGKPAEEAVMTTAEKLEQQGIAKGEARGRAEGEARGRAALVLKQLTLKFGTLSPAVAERVQTASTADLDLWAERILSASTLEDVLR